MKPSMSESGASLNVMNMVFKQADQNWPQLWPALVQLIKESGQPVPKPEFAKFGFTVAALALNLRAVFDLLPREQAERIFKVTMAIFQQQFKNPKHFNAIVSTVKKYIDAYNDGIIKIDSPTLEVAKLLYYNIGLKNVSHKIVDRTFYAPAPKVSEFLDRSLLYFAGSWEAMVKNYDVKEKV